MTNPLLFLLAVLTVLATPGPTNTLLASAAALKGVRGALPLLLAELLGYLVTVDLVGFLLRPLLVANPAIGIALKVAVALYLVVVAVRLWRDTATEAGARAAVGWTSVFVATLLNPKGLIFALAILPFGQPAIAAYLLAFAASIVGVGFLWLVAGRLLGAAAGARRKLVPRAAALLLAGFAGLIAASTLG